jgi:hypothetical protein
MDVFGRPEVALVDVFPEDIFRSEMLLQLSRSRHISA